MAILQLVNAQKTAYMQAMVVYVRVLILLTVLHLILARLHQLHIVQVQAVLVMEQNRVVFAPI